MIPLARALRPPGRPRRIALAIASATVVVVAVGVTVFVLRHRSTPTTGVRPVHSQPGPDFAALYHDDASGVVRIVASTCRGSGIGSGFLLSPLLVVTAAHVLDGAVAVGVTAGHTTTGGEVIGIDDSSDLALIRTRTAISGHVFKLGSSRPPVGTRVGVIGYPEGRQAALRPATIRALDRSIEVEGQARTGLMSTDVLLDRTDSGGPVLATSGAVVGLVDTGTAETVGNGYAVVAARATPLVARWDAAASPPPPASCPTPLGPAGAQLVRSHATGGAAIAITSTLTAYFDGINGGNYDRAYAALGPREKAGLPERQFAASHSSSFDYDITITSIDPAGPGTDLADVSFTSLQRSALGPSGDTCDHWTLAYTMVQAGGQWMINRAAGEKGGANTSC